MAASNDRILKLGIVARSQYAALQDGTVSPRGITLDCVEVAPMPRLFDRMLKGGEFDVSEMAIVTYLQCKQFGKPFTAIPIFPLRAFPHGTIVYNINAGVQTPKDLEGKKVAVRAYAGTAGVWARGLLQREYGVDPTKVTWVINDNEHIQEYRNPDNVVLIKGANLAEMISKGDVAAAIGVMGVDSPDVKPLLAHAQALQGDWYRKTGVYPINNTLVVKDELLASDPWVAESLFAAFKEAKDLYLLRLRERGAHARDEEADQRLMQIVGGDPLPVGIAANRPALELIVDYARDQHITSRTWPVDELFAASTRDLS
jgi:4,5-dihydroxyphthalate decarboxylase